MPKALHRIQIDFDIEADSHEEAEKKVVSWFCQPDRCKGLQDCRDTLVLEENEDVCPTCNPTEILPTRYQEYLDAQLPKTCRGTTFKTCDAAATHWYHHDGYICSYCDLHDYQCGTPHQPTVAKQTCED